MSVVTSFTLHIGFQCTDNCQNAIFQWLKEHDFPPPKSVERYYGGTKHPQEHVYGAGYNYFLTDEFAEFFQTLIWDTPETVILVLKPEEGETKVIRGR